MTKVRMRMQSYKYSLLFHKNGLIEVKRKTRPFLVGYIYILRDGIVDDSKLYIYLHIYKSYIMIASFI